MMFSKGFGLTGNNHSGRFMQCSFYLVKYILSGGVLRKFALSGSLLFTAVLFQACDYTIKNRDVGAASGAVVGGGVGAAVGNAVGNAPAGIAIGAATGGLIGGIVGDGQDVKPVDQAGQEAVLKRQQEEFERQRKEIEDLRRQRIYDDRFKDLTQGQGDNRY